jgi:YfiH family protein
MPEPTSRPKADAMVTALPHLALGILTADCVPVLLADTGAGVIGAAHAGWKGAISGVVEATVEAMTDLGARRERILAATGPAIEQPSYEVGAEFRDRFLGTRADWRRYFEPGARADKFLFDLPGFVAGRLAAAGVATVDRLARDTRAEEDLFFSYRRSCLNGERDYGRQISAIALKRR